MTHFNSKIAAAALIAFGAVIMIGSLATGHSAVAEPPPDLSPKDAGLDVWQAAALLVENTGKVALIDIRPDAQFVTYKVPSSVNAPGAGAAEIRKLAEGKSYGVIIAVKDSDALKLAAELNAPGASTAFHFLKGGAPAWYLAFELPIPMFSDKPVPFGYEEAMNLVRTYWKNPSGSPVADVAAAVGTLARLNYQPSQLQSSGTKPAAGGSAKKITGGCG